MLQIPLQPVPRQELTVTIDQNRWLIRVVQVGDMMLCDFTLNEVVQIQGVRAVPAQKLLPYQYLQQRAGGNFAFTTATGNLEIPRFEDFGNTCFMIYATAEEIANGTAV
ncbi:MAG: hypothetical protein [Bacteriophage sp.]|nr:MAG: hypothetical protein [Bacteriophage sp.]